VPRLRLAELAQATGGSLVRGDPETSVDSYGIDTRKLAPGAVFFALRGARADGHAFLEHAARAGAAAAVVERHGEDERGLPPALILVDSTAAALQRCGSWVRRHHATTRWIAVTGSNGKTTTKEMIAEGLAASGRVHRTPGNLNNQLGVPLTMLAMPDDVEFAVVELAMNAQGEIAALARIVDPDLGLVTNIRAVHMAAFQSLDDVAAAKGELFAVMRAEATGVVNLDDVNVRVQAARHLGPRVTFGQHPSADLRLEQLENRLLPGSAFTCRHQDRVLRLQLRMAGAHAAHNALAALATVLAAGQDLDAAAERIAQLEAGVGRGRVHRLVRGMLLVDDSYNSSPPAVAALLETMRLAEPAGRRVLIFGDMLELGPMETALHREAGRRAAAAGVQVFIGVGPLSREATEAARRAGVTEVHHHPDSGAAAEAVGEFLRDNDLIVVKGSRRMRMERIVGALTSVFEDAH
jgi:UDP-N-acetylmuramoyl-tripeptide--D-alanyl-D-alanine ligase